MISTAILFLSFLTCSNLSVVALAHTVVSSSREQNDAKVINDAIDNIIDMKHPTVATVTTIRTTNDNAIDVKSSKARSLDISMTCQEELIQLRTSEQFQVRFPTLDQEEFVQHCDMTPTSISCNLQGTSMVEAYKSICENAGGKMVQMNMTASGECVESLDVSFHDFPLCAGVSCDEKSFIDAYEEKLLTESQITRVNCNIEMEVPGSGSVMIHGAMGVVITVMGTLLSIFL